MKKTTRKTRTVAKARSSRARGSPIPQIYSAYLNLRSALSDTLIAEDSWEEENWNDATMWISNAIAQLESARAKIYRHQEANNPVRDEAKPRSLWRLVRLFFYERNP